MKIGSPIRVYCYYPQIEYEDTSYEENIDFHFFDAMEKCTIKYDYIYHDALRRSRRYMDRLETLIRTNIFNNLELCMRFLK